MTAYTALIIFLVLVTTILVELARRKKPTLYKILHEWQTGLAALIALIGLGAGAFYADQVARDKERRDAISDLTVLRWEIYGLTFRAEEFVGTWGPRIHGVKASSPEKTSSNPKEKTSLSSYAIGEWARLPERRVYASLTAQVGKAPPEFVRDIMNYHLTVDLYQHIVDGAVKRAVDRKLDAVDAGAILFAMNVICYKGQRLGQSLDTYLASVGVPASVPKPQAVCEESKSTQK